VGCELGKLAGGRESTKLAGREEEAEEEEVGSGTRFLKRERERSDRCSGVNISPS
jgi:hypothetical protein